MFFNRKKKYPIGLIAKDIEDLRDYQLANMQSLAEDLPEEFDLRNQMTPVGRQNWGSCTTWAACAVAEFWNTKEYNQITNLSEKFVYHNMKKISGLWTIQGDYLVNALKSICKYGAPEIKDYPDIKELSWSKYVNKIPSEEIYKKAEKYKGKTYWTVGRTLEEIKSAIYQNKCPVAIGMRWYKNFNKVKKDGILPLPSGEAYGGHAFSCVGWKKDRLIFKNSWGTSSADKGYFYILFKDFDRYAIWNARILLDIKEEKTEGYVAIKYLKTDAYKQGTKVYPYTSLRMRDKPTVKGNKIMMLEKGKECEIASDIAINADNYLWQKVKVV